MTAGELIDALALFTRDTNVQIEDADTNWWLAVLEVRAESLDGKPYVILRGDYHEEGNAATS
jgi:hypothetical protein